ncbi:MAG: 4-alpha-glucanotransferase, partial [Gammaproteobacteria bacterium]|nr:4-alpha-glucanotransferase [Gammaproteobacteria bacterium]
MTERPQPLQRRRAGVLLHPTSLPGAGEHGDLGPEAWRFVDFLADAGFSVWQTLPLGPTHEDRSPYQCLSAHAGNPALIAAEPLVEAGWLDGSRIAGASRRDWLAAAHRGFDERADAKARAAYASFCDKHAHWLQDFTLFMVLRGHHRDAPWWEWPEALRDRDAQALSRARRGLAGELEQRRFEQFLFFSQWARLKDHAERNGVVLFGDLPIFVAYDSAEVWAQREYFAVDAHGRAEVVAGVPPDYFSETGQRWGNPHYRWSRMAEDDYRWWVERMHT